MHAIVFIISAVAGALLFKLAVSIFSPASPNSFLRALVTGFLASVGSVGSALVLGAAINPLLGLVAALVAPLIVVKISYGMSFFRTIVVTVFYGALWFTSAAIVERVIGPRNPPSASETPPTAL